MESAAGDEEDQEVNWANEYSEELETRSDWRRHNRRQRAQERAKQKALQERDYLFREWRKWHDQRLEDFLAGPYAEAARKLHGFLLTIDLDSGDQLIEMVQRGPWLNSDDDTRYEVLRMVNRALVCLREREGLAPIDDALPGEPDTVFQSIREFLK